MDKLLRKAHLYLGCFFAPVLVFFIVSGVAQTFDLHVQRKNSSYVPPQVLRTMAEVHQHQRVTTKDVRPPPSENFRLFVLAMSIGLFLNIALGITMAFKSVDPKTVWVVILLGILVPIAILSMPWWPKTF